MIRKCIALLLPLTVVVYMMNITYNSWGEEWFVLIWRFTFSVISMFILVGIVSHWIYVGKIYIFKQHIRGK